MKEKVINIIFFYPSKNIGGAQLLFCRLGEFIVKKYSERYRVHYIEYKDGFARKYFSDIEKIYYIDYYTDKEVRIDYLNNVHLVSPLNFIYKVDLFVKNSNTKLFFWDLHPLNLISVSEYFSVFYSKCNLKKIEFIYPLLEPIRRKKVSKFLEVGISQGGVHFMSENNWSFYREIFNLKALNTMFLPIFLPKKTSFTLKEKKYKEGQAIQLSWLGRIDTDKVDLLKRFLIDLSLVGRKFVIHIIGGGNEYCNLLKNIDTFQNDQLEVVFVGKLYGDELYKYLIDNIDIHFGIGTSVLEGSILGLPSIVGVSSLHKGNVSAYSWIYKIEGKNLATSLDAGNLKDRVVEFLLDNSNRIGDLCKSHYEEHHSVGKVVDLFLLKLKNNQLVIDDIRQTSLYTKSIFERVLSRIKFLIKK